MVAPTIMVAPPEAKPHGFYLRKWIILIINGAGLAGIFICLLFALIGLGLASGQGDDGEKTQVIVVCFLNSFLYRYIPNYFAVSQIVQLCFCC